MTNTENDFQDKSQKGTNGFKRPFFCGEARILKIQSTINVLEQKSILALTAYIAFNTGASEENVLDFLNTRFGIANHLDLPRTSYEEAVRFLVDLCGEDPTDRKEAAND